MHYYVKECRTKNLLKLAKYQYNPHIMFLHTTVWKSLQSSIMTEKIYFCNYGCIPIGRIFCIKTCQSWIFKPNTFASLMLTQLDIFATYPFGNFTDLRNWQNSLLSFKLSGYEAWGFKSLFPSSFRCNSFFMFKSSKSSLALTVYLVFPLIFIKVPTKLSHIFLSIWITSKICLIVNLDQYSNSKQMFLFVQFKSLVLFFLFLSLLFSFFSGPRFI